MTGKLWESEHGPNGGDEINIIEPGHNYGWGVISMGAQAGITERAARGHGAADRRTTRPRSLRAGSRSTPASRYPGWKNTSLFVCGLVGQQLRRLEISGDKVTHQEVVFDQFGRVHGIVTGPDGYFYVALQNPTAGTTGIIDVGLDARTARPADPCQQMSARHFGLCDPARRRARALERLSDANAARAGATRRDSRGASGRTGVFEVARQPVAAGAKSRQDIAGADSGRGECRPSRCRPAITSSSSRPSR